MTNLTEQELRRMFLKQSIIEQKCKKCTMFANRLKYEPRSELRRLHVKFAWWYRRGLKELRSRMAEVK